MKRIFILSIIALLMTGCKEKLPPNEEGTPMQDVEYGTHPRQKMDISLPSTADDRHKAPVILCIHGGSWSGGDKTDFEYLKTTVNKVNCAYVSINYRLLPDNANFLDMQEDIHTAVAFLKAHSDRYHLKIDKLAIIGSSAGAHLALLYAYAVQSSIKVACVASQSGPADFREMNVSSNLALVNRLCNTQVTSAQLASPDFSFPDAWLSASPVEHVSSASPPTLLAHGVKDELVPYSNAVNLNDKLEKFGVTHQLITFPNSGHELSKDADASKEYQQALADYLMLYLF
ncbi:MAG: alpha/beta hydrolase [Bacteroidales bacterium]|jgi:acetyl esterase/lipase|nr:alpha/beta hydrolase [Bacteroidales bacterium]